MEDSFDDRSSSGTWEGFLTYVGQGISAILVVLAIVILYRGCADKESLLPNVLPEQNRHESQ
jgi:hypothetical protein